MHRNQISLSILDLVSIYNDESAARTLQNSTELVQLADQLGYTRYWFAEHHNTKYQLSTSPELLAAHAAAITNHIRIGTGGIMLPNHSPLKVAEQFSLLEGLHPKRIDLGIGRAAGTDGITALALRRSREAVNMYDFPEQLQELLSYFTRQFSEDHPFKNISPSPYKDLIPQLFMLGSSDGGMKFATHHGLGFAFAAQISPQLAVPMLRAYYHNFQPSSFLSKPKGILSIIVVAADTEEEARYWAAPALLQWVWWLTGAFHHAPLSVEESNAYTFSAHELAALDEVKARFVIGSIDQVETRLRQLAEEAMVDEIMILSMISDKSARHKSFELLAEAFDTKSAIKTAD